MGPASDIKTHARADEVQEALGYRDEQWHWFYWLTREEAKKLITLHPDCPTYTSFPPREQIQLLERLNATLSNEGIPPITSQVLKWRMSTLIRDLKKRQQRKSKVGIACISAVILIVVHTSRHSSPGFKFGSRCQDGPAFKLSSRCFYCFQHVIRSHKGYMM
ncbi:uncharacterized protein EI97DRAFT_406756 [Westerdykella ornata]|uniref:Uncharacterized protein n=1 Tax=Westerdykella ornata TaxID=318751 RepID=A0A6A6J839_WESOR|nr:uncharacterized protein EI97DRAFT_406756 [Westerdykella ornata]KAF2272168.1 hypothetical protein EI97DRAFT_406756 [Westerdykella ornata]